MRNRIVAGCVLLAAGVPGVLFAPVFGLRALMVPIAGVLVAGYLIVELCLRFPGLRPWRPVLASLAGLITLAELELRAGVPGVATVRALGAGVTESWRLTLQSTWPVRPDPELLLFVPLGVLLVAVLGLELSRWPALAVLPSVAMLALSQGFVAQSGSAATVAGLGYALVAAGVFAASTSRRCRCRGRSARSPRSRRGSNNRTRPCSATPPPLGSTAGAWWSWTTSTGSPGPTPMATAGSAPRSAPRCPPPSGPRGSPSPRARSLGCQARPCRRRSPARRR